MSKISRLTLFSVTGLTILNLTFAQTIKTKSRPDSLCGVKINLDKTGGLLPRYEPNSTGKAYQTVVKITSEFIKDKAPIEWQTGKSMLYTTCCFDGPHTNVGTEIVQGKTVKGSQKANFIGTNWMHNPACVYAGLTQSLALDMYPFTGDRGYVDAVRKMLDYQLKYGTTPANFKWANVPYASSNPFDSLYFGATKWENEGMRGDGLHGIEPDKVGELGYAYLKFYQITGEKKYLDAGINCVKALTSNIVTSITSSDPFSYTTTEKSPWPFRLNARNGFVYDPYCAHVIEPIKLLDEVLRIKQYSGLNDSINQKIQKARDFAWNWLFSKSGPMKTYIWASYFEDIPNDPTRSNRNQVSPIETARYFLKNPDKNKNIDIDVQALIYYVKSAFGTDGLDAIKEQLWCY
jgi:hypothetical protein